MLALSALQDLSHERCGWVAVSGNRKLSANQAMRPHPECNNHARHDPANIKWLLLKYQSRQMSVYEYGTGGAFDLPTHPLQIFELVFVNWVTCNNLHKHTIRDHTHSHKCQWVDYYRGLLSGHFAQHCYCEYPDTQTVNDCSVITCNEVLLLH